jgi:hypothetical protein
MDCHRLPLTESEGIASLDSALKNASEHPFQTKNRCLLMWYFIMVLCQGECFL